MEPPPDHPKQLALFTEQLGLPHRIGLELARAGQALLEANAVGRNRVTLFAYDPSPVQ